jgi:hypothetical protein
VLCGHGEQIGGLVRQLADGGLVGDASLRWAKGSTWVLDTDQGRVVGARYLAPPRLKDLAGHYLGVASLGHRRRQAGRRVAGRSTASSCVDCGGRVVRYLQPMNRQ